MNERARPMTGSPGTAQPPCWTIDWINEDADAAEPIQSTDMMRGSLGRSTGRLALVAVGLSAIAGAPVQPGRSSIPFRIIAEGVDSRMAAHRELVIRRPGVWDFVWHKHATSAPPEIDFRRETVIAIFGGTQSTAARVLRIAGVSEEDGSIVVRYREVNDETRREVPSSSASPFVIIAIPPQRPPMKFVKMPEDSIGHFDPRPRPLSRACAAAKPGLPATASL